MDIRLVPDIFDVSLFFLLYQSSKWVTHVR